MSEIVWISIRDGKIVGTPFGPVIPNGKYMIVEALDSEGGGNPQLAAEVIKLREEVERLRGNQNSGSYLEKLIKVHNVYEHNS